MTDDSDDERSKPIIAFPSDDSARERLRRVPPMQEISAGLSKRLRDEWRFLLALRRLGVLIGMYVLFRENACAPEACEKAAEAFRKAGFFALWSGADGLMVMAEPCLALTFMVTAGDQNLLSEELEESLVDIFNDGTPLRMEDHEGALAPIEPFMKSIEMIVSPSFGPTN